MCLVSFRPSVPCSRNQLFVMHDKQFRGRIGLCRGATRAPSKSEDARRQGPAAPVIAAGLLALLTFLALLVLPSCTGTAAWDITPPPTGTWPFDRFGNYHEEFADDRHPDADLYHEMAARGIDILDVSLRGPGGPPPQIDQSDLEASRPSARVRDLRPPTPPSPNWTGLPSGPGRGPARLSPPLDH